MLDIIFESVIPFLPFREFRYSFHPDITEAGRILPQGKVEVQVTGYDQFPVQVRIKQGQRDTIVIHGHVSAFEEQPGLVDPQQYSSCSGLQCAKVASLCPGIQLHLSGEAEYIPLRLQLVIWHDHWSSVLNGSLNST